MRSPLVERSEICYAASAALYVESAWASRRLPLRPPLVMAMTLPELPALAEESQRCAAAAGGTCRRRRGMPGERRFDLCSGARIVHIASHASFVPTTVPLRSTCRWPLRCTIYTICTSTPI